MLLWIVIFDASYFSCLPMIVLSLIRFLSPTSGAASGASAAGVRFTCTAAQSQPHLWQKRAVSASLS